jgi:hypothetical protein
MSRIEKIDFRDVIVNEVIDEKSATDSEFSRRRLQHFGIKKIIVSE